MVSISDVLAMLNIYLEVSCIFLSYVCTNNFEILEKTQKIYKRMGSFLYYHFIQYFKKSFISIYGDDEILDKSII